MTAYDEVVKRILENGRADVVEINGVKFPAVRYGRYFVIRTSDGVKIFDGEHIIEPGFRVYDVHLKQYIPYDLPVKKLLRDFGLEAYVPVDLVEVPMWVMRFKLLLMLVQLGFLFLALYNDHGGTLYYSAFAVIGAAGIVDFAINAKYLRRVSSFEIVVSLIILLFGLAHLV